MHVVGVPEKLANYLLSEASTPNLAIEADSVRIDLIRGIIAKPVRIYQKRVVAPPVMVADTVQIMINPFLLILKKQPVQHVRIVGVEFKNSIQKEHSRKQGDKGVHEDVEFKLEVVDTIWRDVRINSFIGTLKVLENGWSIEDFTTVLAGDEMTGRVWGDVLYNKTKRVVSGAVNTKLDPNILIPWFEVWNMKFLSMLMQRFEVNSIKPYCSGTFSKEIEKGGPLAIDCHIEFEDGLYRNVYLSKAVTELKIVAGGGKKSVVTLDPLIASCYDGTANIKLVIDTGAQKVSFDGELKDVDPKDVCGYIGILTNGFFDVIKMESPLIANASGAFNYGHRDKTDFTVAIESKRIYANKLYAEDVQFTLRGSGVTNYIENFSGDMCNGKIVADGYVFTANNIVATNKGGYKYNINLTDVRFDELIRILGTGKSHGYSGRIALNTELYGVLNNDFLSTMEGSGHVSVDKGEVFSLPIFGGLSRFMTKAIPGLDFVLRQSDASADFVVGNGKVTTDKLHIDGDVLSLTGDGSYYFDKKLDFEIRVKLLKSHTFVAKVIGTITYPISKLFEFKVGGTLDEPEWRPVNFSSEILKKLGLKKDD